MNFFRKQKSNYKKKLSLIINWSCDYSPHLHSPGAHLQSSHLHPSFPQPLPK